MVCMAHSLLSSNRSMRIPLSFHLKGLTTLGLITLALQQVGPGSVRPSGIMTPAWDYGSSSADLPELDSSIPSFWRTRGHQLDLSYPEVATLLDRYMPRNLQPVQKRSIVIRTLTAQMLKLCSELDLQPSFVLAVIEHESAFKPRALSRAGAVGLMQLMPTTAAGVARRIGYRRWIDLRNPVTNITLGMHYLAELKDQFKSSESTLAAYNMGPARWAELQKNPHRIRPGQTLRYVNLIQRTRERMKIDGRAAWHPEYAARLGAGAWL
jgi:hypothetical protein